MALVGVGTEAAVGVPARGAGDRPGRGDRRRQLAHAGAPVVGRQLPGRVALDHDRCADQGHRAAVGVAVGEQLQLRQHGQHEGGGRHPGDPAPRPDRDQRRDRHRHEHGEGRCGEEQLAQAGVEVGLAQHAQGRQQQRLEQHEDQQQPARPRRPPDRQDCGGHADRPEQQVQGGQLDDQEQREVPPRALLVVEAGGAEGTAPQRGHRVGEEGGVDRPQHEAGRDPGGGHRPPAPPVAGRRRDQGRHHQAGGDAGAGPHRERHAGHDEGQRQRRGTPPVPPGGEREAERHQGVAGRDGDVLDVEHRVPRPRRHGHERGRGDDAPAPGAQGQACERGGGGHPDEREQRDAEVPHGVRRRAGRHGAPALHAPQHAPRVQQQGRGGAVDVLLVLPRPRLAAEHVALEEVPPVLEERRQPHHVVGLVPGDTGEPAADERGGDGHHQDAHGHDEQDPRRGLPGRGRGRHAVLRCRVCWRACTTSSASRPNSESCRPTITISTPATSSGRSPIVAPPILRAVR